MLLICDIKSSLQANRKLSLSNVLYTSPQAYSFYTYHE